MKFDNNIPQTPFEKYVSLTTSIIAVALSISSIFSNAVGDDLLMYKSAANYEWSYFQSKSIKQNVFEVAYLDLKTELANPNLAKVHRDTIEARLAHFEKEMERYDIEKNEIKQRAKDNEKLCKRADKQGAVLDLAEALYEIGVVLSAVSLIARSRMLWYVSMFFGLAGMVATAYTYIFL